CSLTVAVRAEALEYTPWTVLVWAPVASTSASTSGGTWALTTLTNRGPASPDSRIWANGPASSGTAPRAETSTSRAKADAFATPLSGPWPLPRSALAGTTAVATTPRRRSLTSLTFITPYLRTFRSPRSVFTDEPHTGSVPDGTNRANGSSVPAEYRFRYQYRRLPKMKLFTQVAHVG